MLRSYTFPMIESKYIFHKASFSGYMFILVYLTLCVFFRLISSLWYIIFGEIDNLNISTCLHLYHLSIVCYLPFKVTKVAHIYIEELIQGFMAVPTIDSPNSSGFPDIYLSYSHWQHP